MLTEGPYPFADLLDAFERSPKLLHPVDEYSLLEKHRELIEKTAATILPVTMSDEQAVAITPPFSNKVIYATNSFRKQFMDKSGALVPFDMQTAVNIGEARKALAYKMILEKFYNVKLSGGDSFICVSPNPGEKIFNYFELCSDWQFMDVSLPAHQPSIPASYFLNVHSVSDLWQLDDLETKLPLEKFVFTGFLLITINQVTQRESALKIGSLLQKVGALELSETMPGITEQLRYLLGIAVEKAGITFFPAEQENGCFLPQVSSIILRSAETDQWKTIIDQLNSEFAQHPVFFTREDVESGNLNDTIQLTGSKHSFFLGLYNDNKIGGCLELYTERPIANMHELKSGLRLVTGFMEQALLEKENRLQMQVTRILKENFTALQHAVEWKFNQAAIDYVTQPPTSRQMKSIVFEDVYPLYGMFDIRNSSAERNKAVQQDLLMQLDAARSILDKAIRQSPMLFLRELESELADHQQRIHNFLLSGDEEAIRSLLKTELARLLQNLSETVPGLLPDLRGYQAMLDPATGLITHHQKIFEKRTRDINHHLALLLDVEQIPVQEMYPHYFERFATDGIEFNIYVGQSITPGKNFNSLYLYNLRLWQLKVLALGARQLNELLEPGIETTQLILVYNVPISIRFRTEERKFDVDHIEHTRYEVIKKRIDKAYIRNTNQRLTEPGTIAIVYLNENDIVEYYRYINYLTKEGLLEGTPEKFELEDLQGVNGLKALRVKIKLEKSNKESAKSKASTKAV